MPEIELATFLTSRVINALELDGWTLTPKINPWDEKDEALASGWELFPLAAEFLSIFDGFSTRADVEIYLGAWRGFSKDDLKHPSLSLARQVHRLFPIGLGAGWVPILLTDKGQVCCSVNGKFAPLLPNATSNLETFILQTAESRAEELLEGHYDS